MKHLTILVPEMQNNIITIAAVREVFTTANTYRKQTGKKELFTIELAGASRTVGFNSGLFIAKPDTDILAITKTDLVIIPSVSSQNYEAAVRNNKKLVAWIKKQYENDAEIVSLCTGAFLLGSTGLLDGKICSTHWSAAEDFKTMFPKVNLQTDKLITDEDGIYTNGGAYSFLNMLIYLVEKYYDRQTAIYCSKILEIEIDRQSQSAFAIFTAQKKHGDEMVRQAQDYIEKNLHKNITIEGLCSIFANSRRNFDRRFLKATGNTPAEYLQRVKIEAAKKAFETSRATVKEVVHKTGCSNMKTFREMFKKITGMSPLEYRNKYNKWMVI